MGDAPSVEKVFFPLDEELELPPSKLAPRQYEHLVHLSCCMPFEKAAQMMEEIVSVQTNEETARRLTEQVGSWMEAAQTAEVEAEGMPESEEQQPTEGSVISPDGAMISLVHKQWAEARTVAIGEPQEKRNASGETEIHVSNLSYFSRLSDASTFTKLAEVEIQRRQVAQAQEVCAVMDGADWLQGFIDQHRPDAVRILDFPTCQQSISPNCWKHWSKRVCTFPLRCSAGVSIFSNIAVLACFCAWLIVWRAVLQSEKVFTSIWTT
jgi:hypothetical protein